MASTMRKVRNYEELYIKKIKTCGNLLINFAALASSAATCISSSVAPSLPYARFSLIVLAKRIGSWLTSPIFFLIR